MKGDFHSQKRIRCGKNMCMRDGRTKREENRTENHLSLFLFVLLHRDRKNNTPVDWITILSVETRSYRSNVTYNPGWFDYPPPGSYTTSVFYYRGGDGGKNGLMMNGSHRSWLGLEERSESLHPSSFRILRAPVTVGRKCTSAQEVYTVLGFPGASWFFNRVQQGSDTSLWYTTANS